MHNEFTAIIEQDDDWFVAYSPEIPGANGQGRTPEGARENLAEAIALILEDRREDGLRGVPTGAIRGYGCRSVKQRQLLRHLGRNGCSSNGRERARALVQSPDRACRSDSKARRNPELARPEDLPRSQHS